MVYAAILAVGLAIALSCGVDAPPNTTTTPLQPAPLPSPGPMVLIGDVAFRAELAISPSERSMGLSGRLSMPAKSGMLFMSDSGESSSFWMRQMLFPLDFIWISKECTVVDITHNVPAPEPSLPDSQLSTYSADALAPYAFEINAGEAEEHGIAVGDRVRFSGILSEALDMC